jgi:hypothetical protein
MAISWSGSALGAVWRDLGKSLSGFNTAGGRAIQMRSAWSACV